MKKRFATAILLVLAAHSAYAHDVPAPCKITIELMHGAELQTIHDNILCLNWRIDLMSVPNQPQFGDASRYMVITRPNLSPVGNPYSIGHIPVQYINPCGKDGMSNQMMCQEQLLRNFRNICESGDCTKGLEKWRTYMSPDWLEYVDTQTMGSEIDTHTLLNQIPNMPQLFESGTDGQLLDMREFFREVSPVTAFGSN